MPKCQFCDKVLSLGTQTCPHCNAPVTAGQGSTQFELEEQIRALLLDDRKIAAIMSYREQTGAGLADAKEAVEALQSEGRLPIREESNSDWESEVLRLLVAGQKIQAIKLYRQQKGVGLKAAKESVESLARQHGIDVRESGCLSVMLLMLIPPALLSAGVYYFTT